MREAAPANPAGRRLDRTGDLAIRLDQESIDPPAQRGRDHILQPIGAQSAPPGRTEIIGQLVEASEMAGLQPRPYLAGEPVS